MIFFKKKPKTRRFEDWAINGVDMSIGFQMLLVQPVNEILRNCRIGNVTKKEIENEK